ncbi:hypothetical protein H9Y04_22880 [Streptomyces sp. TRM66268-LWL]|uniref:Uncharacterized protein n=1 Tax=Streptomyces polyasparticus TaxID=2767826 RepID=A0ABR7SIY2_9ACTN|nr:hypothetical protein [Streptomyces polyasparticus]MBC9715398.1 hypothetical protein [Streptomyces polyasparticus]
MSVEAVDALAREGFDHFDDFAASVRRLLPDLTRQLAAGVSGAAGGFGGVQVVGHTDWSLAPDDERAAVLGFFEAWWLDTLRSPQPLYSVDDVFQTCATATRTVTPYLAAWVAEAPGGTADVHLCAFLDLQHLDLINEDERMIGWWTDYSRPEPMAEIVTWVLEHGVDRIRAQGAPSDLLSRLELLRIPGYEERWAAYEARFLT